MDDFDAYLRASGTALLRFAYLLCGDAHRAEDFAQEVLVGCHRRWRRIERDVGPDAYVRKAILRQYLSWRRCRPATGQVVDRFAARGSGIDTAQCIADRDAVSRVLAPLPRRQRAVVVLCFYEDLPDNKIAELLGCSRATARRYTTLLRSPSSSPAPRS